MYTGAREWRNSRPKKKEREEGDTGRNRRIWAKLVFCVTFLHSIATVDGWRYIIIFVMQRRDFFAAGENEPFFPSNRVGESWMVRPQPYVRHDVASGAVATVRVRRSASASYGRGCGRAIHVPGKVGVSVAVDALNYLGCGIALLVQTR